MRKLVKVSRNGMQQIQAIVDWMNLSFKNLHKPFMPERLMSFDIMGSQLRAPLKLL